MSRRAFPEPWLPEVPRIIHQMWLPSWRQAPAQCRSFRAAWCALNPDWEYRFWDLQDVERLISHYGLTPLWEDLKREKTIKLADLARIVVLYHFGGLYVDMDIEPVSPLECHPAIGCQKHPDEHHIAACVEDNYYGIDPEMRVNNGFIAATAKHPALWTMIRAAHPYRFRAVLDFMGPRALGRAIRANFIPLPTGRILSPNRTSESLVVNHEIRSWGEPNLGPMAWFTV